MKVFNKWDLVTEEKSLNSIEGDDIDETNLSDSADDIPSAEEG